MVVKKKPQKSAKKIVPAVDPVEVQASFDKSRKEIAEREADAKKIADLPRDKKTTKKRLDQIVKNDMVKVEVIDTIPLGADPLSAVAIRGLMDYAVAGTHLRLLGMADPSETPSTEQRVAMAKRLNEVAPLLPRYIKTFGYSSKMPKEKIEPEEPADLEQAKKDVGIDEHHHPKDTNPKSDVKKEGGHNWVKQNLVSNPDGSDDYACENEGCKGKFKRRGLGWNPPATQCIASKLVVSRTKVAQKMTTPPLTDGVPLKKICSDVDIDPKLARRALRSAKIDKPGGRWEWPKDQVDKIKAILQKARDDEARSKL